MMRTAVNPKSKMCSIIEENLAGTKVVELDRRYWAENSGLDFIQKLAFLEDVETIKVAVEGNYFATCCIAAVLSYVESTYSTSFAFHSLRFSFQPPEGSMMIDLSTIQSLELIQNIQNARSKDCLFGLLNETLTPMGSRLLRSNVLQPLTDSEVLKGRYDAVEELTTKEDMFFATRQALKSFLDVDKILTTLIIIPTKHSAQTAEQAINNILMLKNVVDAVEPIHDALSGARSHLLKTIRSLCAPEKIEPIENMIRDNINDDVTYQQKPLDLKNQRTYAVRSGVNGLLDVARQTFKDANADVYELCTELQQAHELGLEVRYDTARQFYLRFSASELDGRNLDPIFVNVFRKKNMIECQTLELMKRNQRIADSHAEVILMSDELIQNLIENLRHEISVLFKLSEGLAMLDMSVCSFGQLVTTYDYVRPELTETLAIQAGRHPIREKIQAGRFVPNDVYATQQRRFQIITAQYASFPITRQLFARVSIDDSIEANVSTFAAEMRETAFILRNLSAGSMIIIDELGRGTSTRDGLAIALSVAEALVESRALVWFVTHFRDLAHILSERNGVVNLHLAVEMTESDMKMLYKLSEGCVTERHYGLALARVLDLPPDLLDVATKVSNSLTQQIAKRKKSSKAFATTRRRKLILNLKESLIQARDGVMEGEVLASWLRKLQAEFVARMTAIDAEANQQSDDDDEETESRCSSGDVSGMQQGTASGARSYMTTNEQSRYVQRTESQDASPLAESTVSRHW
ncbi:MAG: MutS protein msh4 [Piccolia ochrophora]|nr:MAG: MutS protein msh4 [Piccolia ochrophora]